MQVRGRTRKPLWLVAMTKSVAPTLWPGEIRATPSVVHLVVAEIVVCCVLCVKTLLAFVVSCVRRDG